MTIQLETDRLILRQWKKSDYSSFAEMTANPKVMRFFPAVLSKEKSDQMAHKIESLITERGGWGLLGSRTQKYL